MTAGILTNAGTLSAGTGPEALAPALERGVEFVRAVRAAAPGLDGAARLFHLAGDPLVLVCLACCALWFGPARRGLAGALAVIAANAGALGLAAVFRVPPPSVLAPGIGLAVSGGFSFPSARAATSFVLFATILLGRRDASPARTSAPVGTVLALAASVPFALAGVYLGANYPTDALAGWALGALLFCVGRFAVMPAARFASRTLDSRGPRARRNAETLAAAAFAVALNSFLRDGSLGGIAFGLCAGVALLGERTKARDGAEEKTRVTERARPGQQGSFARAPALLFALAVLALVLVPLARVLPGPDHAQYELFRFARHALAGFWAGYAVPALFSRISPRNTGL